MVQLRETELFLRGRLFGFTYAAFRAARRLLDTLALGYDSAVGIVLAVPARGTHPIAPTEHLTLPVERPQETPRFQGVHKPLPAAEHVVWPLSAPLSTLLA